MYPLANVRAINAPPTPILNMVRRIYIRGGALQYEGQRIMQTLQGNLVCKIMPALGPNVHKRYLRVRWAIWILRGIHSYTPIKAQMYIYMYVYIYEHINVIIRMVVDPNVCSQNGHCGRYCNPYYWDPQKRYPNSHVKAKVGLQVEHHNSHGSQVSKRS